MHLPAPRADRTAPQAQPGGVLFALQQLLAKLPLPNSTLADMGRHERDHAILTAERGRAAAEAVMWNVYAFEYWRRNRNAP